MSRKTLRRYERVAQREHFCDRCCEYIHPGEMYEGIVSVNEDRKEHRVTVSKTHIHPGCDYPPDPEEERRAREEIKSPRRAAA